MVLKNTVAARAARHEKALIHTPKKGSVQERFVDVRTIHDHILCLRTKTPGCFEYATMLQIEGISYDLKSEEEQRQINALYQGFLCALPYPVQILWRVLPLNLSAYLDRFSSKEGGLQQGIWEPLQESHRRFLQYLASQRTLLDRKIYLIIRVNQAEDQPSHGLLSGKKRQHRHDAALSLERARQELDLRVSELIRVFSNMHVSVRQLSGEQEVAPVYYSCLTPQRAALYPLSQELIEGIDRPVLARLPQEKVISQRQKNTEVQERQQEVCSTGPHVSGFAQLADLLAPAAVVVSPDLIKIEDEYARTIVVSHLPRLVAPGWLKPLAELDEPMEVSFHLQPLNSAVVLQQFRRRQMEYQSSRLMAHRKGNEVDPNLKVAESDVDVLIDRLASGEERMLDLSMLVVLRGASRQELNERTERIRSVLQNMLLKVRTALFEQEQGFRSCLPTAHNELGKGILLDSRSASTMFPFLSNSLFHPDGILEGITPQGDPVVLDAWSQEMANANRIILGPPGWGKSHHVKTSIVRMALKYAHVQQYHKDEQEPPVQRFQVIVIDPEREYGRLTAALGGQVIRLAPGARHHINPFDLPYVKREQEHPGGNEHGDRLADHVQRLHSLLEIMLADRTPDHVGKLTANEKGLLDRALYECYRKVGITTDSKTHERPAPLMRDLYEVLDSGICGPDPTALTARLRRYVHGSLAGLFSGPSDIALENAVIVFDIHDMETELRPVGLFLVSNFVWTQSFQSSIPRQLIVDEAATLYQFESGARFLEDLVRRARKHYLGVTIISQHPAMFRDSAIPANCATHVLMRQDATSLDLISTMFKLSDREVQLLRRLGIGEALLTTSEKRLHVRFETSELEHILATTNPQEIASWKHDSRYADVQQIVQGLLAFDGVIDAQKKDEKLHSREHDHERMIPLRVSRQPKDKLLEPSPSMALPTEHKDSPQQEEASL
ncbi:hypothetical protein KDW_31160 [Dictyobacter vulcani]|uniref:TraG P-loop domain-containing protein n=1 Tax=Dictyobacter vulcani TaxID=2607529 RepID=A0A5J4KHL5_9CHLR|nr:VirB4 family type IV secretion system protein [Dictyobacter vulcani]GER88954.1 hypothetical protein KDW_31160 [Dictyobacter vulcani]